VIVLALNLACKWRLRGPVTCTGGWHPGSHVVTAAPSHRPVAVLPSVPARVCRLCSIAGQGHGGGHWYTMMAHSGGNLGGRASPPPDQVPGPQGRYNALGGHPTTVVWGSEPLAGRDIYRKDSQSQRARSQAGPQVPVRVCTLPHCVMPE
jgi:hypothetical protein